MNALYLSQQNKVLQFVEKQTLQQLNSMDVSLGVTASDVASEFNVNRANCSRILNSLHQDGFVSKRIGKPTFFISRKAIEEIYPLVTFPAVISKEIDIYTLLKKADEKQKIVNLETDVTQIIGSSQNESLYEQVEQVKKIAAFPGTTGSLLVQGLDGCGQTFFIKKIIQIFKLSLFFNRKFALIEIDPFSDTRIDENLIQIKKNLKNKRIQLILFTNFDFLSREELFRIKLILKENRLHYQKNNNFFIFSTIRSGIKKQSISLLKSEIDHEIFLPLYINRTAKEKVEFIFKFLQNEANLSNRTITVDKNTVCCIGMSGSIATLHDLRKIIRQTLLNALRNRDSVTDEIIVDISDIPANVLDQIYPSKDFIEELNSIFYIFEKTTFNFIPFKLNDDSQLLRGALIDSNQLLSKTERRIKNLENIIQKDITLTKSTAYITCDQLSTEEKKIYTVLVTLISTIMEDKQVLFLAKKINNFASHKTNFNYDYSIKKNAIFELSAQKAYACIKQLEGELSIYLTEEQKNYLIFYIYYSSHEFANSKLSIIMAANWNKISQTYADHFNRQYAKIVLHPSNLSIADFEKDPHGTLQKLKLKISKVNQGKGVLLISDSNFPEQLKDEVTKLEDILILENLSFNSISKIVHITLDNNSEIGDFTSFQTSDLSYPNDSLSTNLLKEIDSHILKKNLAFLDSEKAINISSLTLHDILNDLSIEYQNEIAITFLLHTCFMIERVIRKTPLTYKGINKLITKNGSLYHSIERRLKKIEDSFSITIPSSEIAYIVEIFIEYFEYNKIAKSDQSLKPI